MKINYTLLLLLFPIASFAQPNNPTKKKLSMKQAVMGLYTDLRVANLSQLQFCGSSDTYSYTRKEDGKQIVYTADPSTHEPKTFITLSELNGLLKTEGLEAAKRLPSLQWIDDATLYFRNKESFYLLSRKSKNFSIQKLASVPKGANITATDSKKRNHSFVKDHNLFISSDAGNQQITTDGTENIVYGQAVHRFEFGITNGSFWSPKANFLAFYRMDQTMVNDYPVIDWSVTPAKSKNIKYPMAGGTSHEVKLGIYDKKNKATQYLEIKGPKDQYLTSVSWSPDEKHIYVGVLSRSQKVLNFTKYDVTTGKKVKTVFTDKNDKYVEPQHPLWFYNNDPNEFVWLSQRDGFMHMYLYKNDALVKQITKGNWIVNEILGFNSSLNEIIFTGTKDGAMEKNIYAVSTKDNEIRKINTTGGWHSPKLSKSGKFIIDAYSNFNTPRNIEVLNVAIPKSQKRLLTAKNTLAPYQTAKVKLVRLKVENNTILNGKLIYPSNFDSSKTYPAIVYLYNGPHVQLVKNTFPYTGNLWYDYMADKGYFIFVMDGRGSSNRGFAFESATHRKLGEVEMRDQMKGVNFLKSLPFIDGNRLGVHGWSYGGYMTTSLMTQYPDVFKCAVAGGPVMDWKMYEIMYTERYMDSPDSTDNKKGYDNTRIWNQASKLKNNLLIIHGAQDDVVVWQHSMKFIRDAVKNNKPVDYFVYPSHPHNVRGKDRIHLMQKITDYFDLHLK
jgi:dipeptidyl-peptidase-4